MLIRTTILLFDCQNPVIKIISHNSNKLTSEKSLSNFGPQNITEMGQEPQNRPRNIVQISQKPFRGF